MALRRAIRYVAGDAMTATEALQHELLRLGALPERLFLAPGTFDAATANALWLACKSGALHAQAAEVLAARAEVCGPMAAGTGQPVPGAAILVNGAWVPVPNDVPLWCVPYNLGVLKGRKRTQSIVQVILHHDGGRSALGTWGILKDRGLSSHGSVDDNGIFRQFDDLVRRVTWHALGHKRTAQGVVEEGFNLRSIGIDWSNPVLLEGKGAQEDADRPLATEIIHGRAMTLLDFYPCQEEAGLALLRMILKAVPTIGHDYRAEATWDGDLTGDTPGVWGHYHVHQGKVDPFGFPMHRIPEAFGG